MNLKSDTLIYGGAVLADRLFGLLLLALLTRLVSIDEVGVWTQTAVASSVLLPWVLLGLPLAIVRFFADERHAGERRRWMLRVAAGVAAATLFAALVAWLARDAVATALWGSAAQRLFVAALLPLLAADAMFELLVAFQRAASRMRTVALLMLARGTLRLAVMALALGALGQGFAPAFVALALCQLLAVALAFGLALPPRGATPSPATLPLRTLLGFALPLVAGGALAALNSFADRFVLTQFAGLAAVANYAVVASLVAVAGLVHSVLGFTLFPAQARLWAAGERDRAAALAQQSLLVFLFAALPFVVWLTLSIDEVLAIVATRAYGVAPVVVALLGAAAVAFGVYQTLLYPLLLARRGTSAALGMALAVAVNVAANLLLVPRFGLAGAAASALASNALLAVAGMVLARRALALRFPWLGAARIALAAALGALVLGAVAALPGLAPPAAWAAGSLAALAVYLAADLAPGPSLLRRFGALS